MKVNLKPKALFKFPVFAFAFIFIAIGCEEDVTVDLPKGDEHLVIESHIENGAPPYAILTRDQAYFTQINQETLNDLFIRNVDTFWMTDYQDTMALQKINPRDLPPDLENEFLDAFRVGESEFRRGLDLVIYLPDFSSGNVIRGSEGGEYKLYVKTPNHEASATTTITERAKLDSVYYKPDGPENKYAQVFIKVDDPKGKPSFYRYLTKRNSEPFYAPLSGSVATDEAVDGTVFNFPINRAYPRTGTTPSNETFGLFKKGDTVVVKFCALDREHYKFWSTLEEDLRNQGNPFGSPTIIQNNINGGLGIFGGYSCDYDTVVIR